MDLQLLIAVNLMVLSALTVALGLIMYARGNGSMLAVHAALLALGVAALTMQWPQPGTLLAAAYLPLVVAPGVLSRIRDKKSYAGDAKAAAWYARLVALFHPSPQARLSAKVASVMAIKDASEGVRQLRAYAAGLKPAQRLQLEVIACRMEGRWDHMLEVFRANPDIATELKALHIRALGETGQTAEMVQTFARGKGKLQGQALRDATLFVLAFAGARDGVEHVLDGHRRLFDAATASYWRAVTAYIADPDSAAARTALLEIAAMAPREATRDSARRILSLAGPLGRAALTPPLQAEVAALEARMVRDAPLRNVSLLTSRVTLTLVVLNCAMFALEIYAGGAEDADTLISLGALWPPAVVQDGQWWRVVSALFLHFGWPHIIVNMLSLIALGRLVEALLGPVRMLAVYLLGGVASSSFVLSMMVAGRLSADILVGASGAIMALFGAFAAIQLRYWLSSRDALDRRALVVMAVIMAVQIAADMSIPEVSLAGHLSGFIAGFALSLLLGGVRAQER